MSKKAAQTLVQELQDVVYRNLTNERKRSFMSFLNMQPRHPVEVVRAVKQLAEVISTTGNKELQQPIDAI